jgi:hypothetical protein
MGTNHTGEITYQAAKRVMPEEKWQAMTLQERLEVYPFLTDEQAQNLIAYIAIDKNLVNKILAYVHDMPKYASIVGKYPNQRLDYDEGYEIYMTKLGKQAKKKPQAAVRTGPIALAPGIKPMKKDEPEAPKPFALAEGWRENTKPVTAEDFKPKADEQKQSSAGSQPEKQLGGGVKKAPNKRKGKAGSDKEVQGSLF